MNQEFTFSLHAVDLENHLVLFVKIAEATLIHMVRSTRAPEVE